MSRGDGGYKSMRLLLRVTHDGRDEAEPEAREPKKRQSIEEAIRASESLGPLTRKEKQRIRARLGELRLRWDSADALADWLKNISDWEWFGSVTFRNCKSLDYAMRTWTKWLDRINKKIYGRRYRNRPDDGIWGFVAFERQVRGDWHAHFIAADVRGFDQFLAMKHWESVTRTVNDSEGSYPRIFLYDHERGGAGYCAKYVTKEATGQGAWEVFGPWPPERWPLFAALA